MLAVSRRAQGLMISAALLGLVPRAEATLIEIYSKPTFIATTGATSVVGPLPDLGFVPGGSTTLIGVGTLGVSISPPSSALFIGASGVAGVPGDWYGPLPGNDIAISDRENLNFNLSSPVYSFGFDFVEPNTTMPSYGGSPVDSTFLVTLKSGASTVGSFSFNRPDDLVGFVGMWTDFAFDRVEISESIGGIDDEYFGEVYAGTDPIPEPTTLLLLGAGLSGLALRKKGPRS